MEPRGVGRDEEDVKAYLAAGQARSLAPLPPPPERRGSFHCFRGQKMSIDELTLSELAEHHPGLTRPIATCFAEAASVCFDRHHSPPCELSLDHAGEKTLMALGWKVPSGKIRNAWANDIDTTESGACGVCLAVVHRAIGLVAVRRAETRKGADYYLAPIGANVDDLENCIRLEVSGVDRGDATVITRRLAAKVKQTRDAKTNLPALAVVCGFKERLVLLSAPIPP